MNHDDIITLLEKLAEKLTPAAQHVWDLAVRQMILEGAGSAILAGIGLLALAVVLTVLLRTINGHRRGGDLHIRCDHDLFYMAWGCAGFIAGLFITVFGADALGKLLNPEWAVLQMLGGLIK